KSVAGHQHTRSAVSALQAVLLEETFLKRMELTVRLETFDCQHFATIGLNREHRTRLHCAPVQYHGARSAVTGVAADMRAGEAQGFANEVDKQQPRFYIGGMIDAVDFDIDRRHRLCASFRSD